MTTKKKMFCTLDTECVGLQPQNFVYDLAWCIHDRNGNIAQRYNFLVRDIVTDANKMMGAYYAKKIFSHYIPALDAGKVSLADWSNIAVLFRESLDAHNVSVIAAYNARFDIGAMRATNALLTGQKMLNRSFDLLCIWDFACRVLLNRPTYKNLATAKGWISEAKNFRTNAECAYRYVSGQPDFIENHTALDDAEIETEVLAYCFRQRKKIPYNMLTHMPWRIPNTA